MYQRRYLAVCLVVLIAIAHGQILKTAFEQEEKVIYGSDNRKEPYYFDGDSNVMKLINAGVAIFDVSQLSQHGDGSWSIDNFDYFYNAQDSDGSCNLCSSEPFRGQPLASYCSGFLVADNKIVTAGHCVAGSSCSDMAFIFNWDVNQNGDAKMDNIPDEDVFFCQDYRYELDQDSMHDWAVVLLDRQVAGRDPLPVASSTPSEGTDLIMVGHPWGLPMKVDNGASVKLVDNSPMFQASTDSYAGNSGSMVVNAETWEVVGILVEGNIDFKTYNGEDCCRSNVCSESTGCGGVWESITKIQIVPDWSNWNSAYSTGPVAAMIFLAVALML